MEELKKFVEIHNIDMLELEQMEELKLFENQEIKHIIKQRTKHENNIQIGIDCQDNYYAYIKDEMKLLELIRLKKERLAENLKVTECMIAIAKRINKIFQLALLRFQAFPKLWQCYIKFCKREQMQNSVDCMLELMMRIHSNIPNVWKLAADWEYCERGSVAKARQYLQEGIRLNPESTMLYLESFRLELSLMNADGEALHKIAKEEAELLAVRLAAGPGDAVAGQSHTLTPAIQDQIVSSQGGPLVVAASSSSEVDAQQHLDGMAELILNTAMNKFLEVNFIISLLSITTTFDFTRRLQEQIIDVLMTNFSKHELTWDMVARCVLKGLRYNSHVSSSGVEIKFTPTRTIQQEPSKEDIELSCEVYKEAVKEINTKLMWTMYIKFLEELNQNPQNLPRLKRNLLLSAFKMAHLANCLCEKSYLQWVALLQSIPDVTENRIDAVFCMALETLSSIELWTAYLCYYIRKGDNDKKLRQVFEQAVSRLGDTLQCLDLWKMILQYYMIRRQTHTMVDFTFEEGVLRGPEISSVLKPMYLDWIILSKGILAARKVYSNICIMHPPPCFDIHTKMLKLESIQPVQNIKQIRKCYKLACDQFGKTNKDIWMEYIKFEITTGRPLNVTSIYEQASKMLEPSLADIFISEYCSLESSQDQL